MRETLVIARDRRMYLGHAKPHMARIQKALPRVKARAEAQERGDPAEADKTGCIARLADYERQLEQYASEFKLYREMTGGEDWASYGLPEVTAEEVDHGGR